MVSMLQPEKLRIQPALDAATALKAESKDLNFHYGAFHALKSINMPLYEKKVTALIGPSGCGKSTLLRIFNRIYALYPKLEAPRDAHPQAQPRLDA